MRSQCIKSSPSPAKQDPPVLPRYHLSDIHFHQSGEIIGQAIIPAAHYSVPVPYPAGWYYCELVAMRTFIHSYKSITVVNLPWYVCTMQFNLGHNAPISWASMNILSSQVLTFPSTSNVTLYDYVQIYLSPTYVPLPPGVNLGVKFANIASPDYHLYDLEVIITIRYPE